MSEYRRNGRPIDTVANTQYNRNISAESRSSVKREVPQPNAYLIAKMNNKSGVSDVYRHGEYNGQKYMTTGDFLRYYNRNSTPVSPNVQQKRASAVTKEFKRPAASVATPERRSYPVAAEKEDVRIRSAEKTNVTRAVSKYDPQADTIVMPAHKQTKTIKGRIAKMVAKWFPQESKNAAVSGEKKRFPVAVVGLLISLSVAMTVMVSTSVVTSRSQAEMSNLKNEISALEKEDAYLEEELIKRDDLAYITKYATEELGMIKEIYGSSVYLELGENDSVSGTAEDGQYFAALLAAMFGE
jgi:cell division protein FtsB